MPDPDTHAEAAAQSLQRIEQACYHDNQPGLVIPATEQGQVAADFRTLKQFLNKQLSEEAPQEPQQEPPRNG